MARNMITGIETQKMQEYTQEQIDRTECEMSAPGAYDIDIEADDINVTDTATVIWEIA